MGGEEEEEEAHDDHQQPPRRLGGSQPSRCQDGGGESEVQGRPGYREDSEAAQ